MPPLRVDEHVQVEQGLGQETPVLFGKINLVDEHVQVEQGLGHHTPYRAAPSSRKVDEHVQVEQGLGHGM